MNFTVLIGIAILILLVFVIHGMETFIPNFNYDSGVEVTTRAQVWTQPQMVGEVGLGDTPPREAQDLTYTKYKQDYIRNLYDYGNIFHIPTSVTNSSDTTEDNLQGLMMERSRYARAEIPTY